MPYFDSHCHLAMDQFDPDRPEVIALCQQAGVGMLTVGVDVGSSRAGVDLARRHPGVWAGVGVHPCDCLDLGEEDWQTLQDLARLPEVVAVGETGLDNHWRAVPLERQAYWFRQHLELALAVGKPVSIHARESAIDMLEVLPPYLERGLQAVWHCFTLGRREAVRVREFLALHPLYLGLGGLITFTEQKTVREIVSDYPGELILLETDAPFLLPRPHLEKARNDPRGVIRVAEELALLRDSTPAAMADLTTANACRLFKI